MESVAETSMFSLVDLDLPMSPFTGQYDPRDLELLEDFPADFDFSMLDADHTIDTSTSTSIIPSPRSGGLSVQLHDSTESRGEESAVALEGKAGTHSSDTGALHVISSSESGMDDREEAPMTTGLRYDHASLEGAGRAGTLVREAKGQGEIPTAKHGEISEYIREIRHKLDHIEAILSLASPSHSGERKRDTTRRPTKRSRRCEGRRTQKAQRRRKADSCVTLKASRVFLHNMEFVWKQSRGHNGYWHAQGDVDEFHGCELLTFSSEVSVELRPNLDWLPILVRWNKDKGQFEGFDNLDEHKKLVVSESAMLDIVSDPEHQRGQGHVEWVS